jgi:DGQHR domain-containing protein
MAEFLVNARVLRQRGHDLYLFVMASDQLDQISYVTPRSQDDPNEIQRLLNPKRVREIGEYLQDELSLLPNAIVVSLGPDVRVGKTGSKGEVTLTFPSNEGKYAYILDGQHRVEGFKESKGVVFDLPVVGLHNADENLRIKVFADINSKQVRVSEIQLLALYHGIKALPVDQGATYDVVLRLNDGADSPLKDRVKVLDDQKNTWVKNTALVKWVGANTRSGGAISQKTVAEQARIFTEYFKGVSLTWPEAWTDKKNYSLTKPYGIEAACAIFAAVKHRVDLNKGKQYTAANFASQLDVLKGIEIEIGRDADDNALRVPLTWKTGSFGPLQGAGGKALLFRQLVDVLQRADED